MGALLMRLLAGQGRQRLGFCRRAMPRDAPHGLPTGWQVKQFKGWPRPTSLVRVVPRKTVQHHDVYSGGRILVDTGAPGSAAPCVWCKLL
jgi:hypothetical protein